MPDLGHLVDLPFTPVATSIRCPRFNTNNSLSIEYQWLLKTFSTKYNSFMNTKTSKPFSLEPQSTNSQGTQFSHGVRLRCTWEEATTGQRQVGGKYSIFHRIPSPLAKIISLHVKSTSIPSLECQSLCQSWSNHCNTAKFREGPGGGDQYSNQLLERESTAVITVRVIKKKTNKQMDFRKRKTSHSLHIL